jgi:hypothetical protein
MTTTPDPAEQIRAAEQREALARQRLTGTLHELQARLNPKALAREGARKVADAGQTAASKGADAARRNPAPVAGAAAVGVLFLARKRIAGLFRRNKKTAPAEARYPATVTLEERINGQHAALQPAE